MKDKDILNKIRQEANVHEPDLRDFIHRRFSTSTQQPFFSWPTLSIATLFVSLALIILVINPTNINPSLSNSTTSETSSTSETDSSVVNPPLLLAERQPFSIAAVSTTSLLPTVLNGNEPATPFMRLNTLNEDDFDQVIDQLSDYFPLVEQIITEQGAPVITTYDVTINDPYFGKFMYRDVIESTDLTGTALTYQMYYNVIAFNESTPISIDNFRIRGLLIVNQTMYGLIGSKSTVAEDIVFQFSSFLIVGFDDNDLPILDNENFVFSRYVFSEETTRYRIIRFIDGVAVQSTWMNIEVENDQIKIILVLETDNTTSIFQFKYDQASDDQESSYAGLEVRFRLMRSGEKTLAGRLRLFIIQDELGHFIYRLRVTEGDFKDKEKDENRPNQGGMR